MSKGKDLTEIIYTAFWYNGRSELIAMERDILAQREGYSAQSYIWALKEGLIPIYKPLDIYQMDNALIYVKSCKGMVGNAQCLDPRFSFIFT